MSMIEMKVHRIEVTSVCLLAGLYELNHLDLHIVEKYRWNKNAIHVAIVGYGLVLLSA